ncbi:MAG: gliding motility-associated C-terminal domain-containing protein [Bacteroidales bacterium]|nr:gliding motility-associated C-terminal domain-containing protein [Bacteroidales bacterium]
MKVANHVILTVLFTFGVIQACLCQSPCDPNGIHASCTDQNPYGITYASGTSGDASSFLGANSSLYGYGCLGSLPAPAYYYMKISSPGDLLIHIQQYDNTGTGLDVDFACWGPFNASSQQDFITKLCNGTYQLTGALSDYDWSTYTSHCPSYGYHDANDASTWGGYPIGNLVDCSYDASEEEWCYIPNAQIGQFYLLVLTNYSEELGTITFSNSGGTAKTDCSLLAPINNNGPLCEGETLELACENYQIGATYHWTGPNGWSANTQYVTIPNATVSMSGSYSCTMSYNGETDVQTTTVVINAQPTITITPPVANLCNGDNVTLTASGADTYVWNTGETTASITVTPSAQSVYTVTGTTAAGCVGTNSAVAMSSDNIIYTLPDVVCEGSPITVQPNNPTSTYVWDNGSTGASINPDVTVSTLLTVTVTDANGCVGTASVTVNPKPNAGFEPDNYFVEIEDGSATINFIDQSEGADQWWWNFADSHSESNTSEEASPSHIYTYSGYYNVKQTVANEYNCRDSVTRLIRITSPFHLYIPSAFTPGKTDGLNDLFAPVGIGVSPENYEMVIYNQWGQIVFKTNELFAPWDGYFQGKLAPLGVYVYRLSLQNLDEEEKIYVGTVTLVK